MERTRNLVTLALALKKKPFLKRTSRSFQDSVKLSHDSVSDEVLGVSTISFSATSQIKAMVAPSKIDPATAILDRFGHSKSNTYASLSGVSGVPASTLGHRKNGRLSIQ
jgi:hypothetical protein